ncbi:hypothetical protein DM01DRAFT_1038014 [Hesseltinella vesiculosa]|uniref:Xylanolytic transcriptional activator regulatory domain-containing protein n=1 Tax=Hesseltinella vesiculosa TaxID=101127 RepID=A0A1X2GIM4_9FUNG|nr:hypothetical protein DM01DRAFT_1038014 [Hesseltinella vesiculosa]
MQQWHRQLVDPLLCHAVAALGARCCPTSGPDANPSKPFFDHCLFLLEQPGPRDHASSLSTVQALLLLCWYTHLCGQMQTCAHLRQKLLQANDQLGLHRDPDSSAGLVCMEMHRRAYWITFVTDRWLCWCLDQCGLPAQPLIQTNSPLPWPRLEDQQLYLIDKKSATNDPSDLDDLTTTTAEHALQITTFAELIKLASIMDDIARFTRPSLCSDPHRRPGPVPLQVYQRQLAPLATKLTTWLLQLPYYLEFCRPVEDQPPAPMASLYHLMYYTVQIMLNQPLAMFPTPPNAPEPSPTLARTICTNACNTILHLAEQMLLHHQLPFLGNVAILSLNLAASLYLYEPLGLPLTSLMPHQHLHTIFKTITLLKQCLPDPVPAGLSDLHHAVDGFLFHHYQIRLLQDTDRPDPLPSDPWSSPDDVKPRKKRRYSQSSGSPLSTPDLSSRSPMSSVTMTVTPTASLPSCDHSPLLISPQLDGDLLDVGLDTLLHEVSPLASPSSTCPSPCSPKDWTAAWIEEHAELWAFMNVQPPLPHDQSHLASAHLNPPCPSATMTQSALVSHPMLPLHPPLDHFLVHGLSHPPMTKCTNWICPNNDDLIDPYTYTFMLDNSLVIP